MTAVDTAADRLWTGAHARVVAGVFALAFLVAFESLAVATIMPVVADELDGLGLYALAFAAPTAVSVVAMTVAGPWVDRRGPSRALETGVGVFGTGLLVAGLAPTMPVFLAGRAVQGLGVGFVTVGLYVVVGRVFPDHLRARAFTVMTSAWVLPALVGPFLAGTIAELVGWRWVFLAVPVVAVGALLLVREALVGLDGDPSAPTDRRRVWWALAAAVGVLSISVAGQRGTPVWPVLLVASLALVLGFGPRLLPTGTWRGRRGLPAVIATRSLLGAGYFGAETYVPLSLVTHRGLGPAQAGLLLTVAAVLWFGGSWLAAHLQVLADEALRVRIGSSCVLVGILADFLTLVDDVPVIAIALVWGVGGLGMGLAASTLSVLVLGHSAPGEQGANSAALQTSGSLVESTVLAVGSVVFATLLAVDATAGYVSVLALATIVGVLGVGMSTRLGPRPG